MSKLLKEIHKELEANSNPKPVKFFKTGEGQYAETDKFLDVKVPILRRIAKEHKEMSREDLQGLLDSAYNEERQLGLFILADQYKRAKKNPTLQEDLYHFYLSNLSRVNNWNLVDSSAHLIMGEHLMARNRDSLLALVRSTDLWERRVAMVATWQFIRSGDFEWTIKLAEELLEDKEDLMHKASGWMLREAGERDEKTLKTFLDKWAHKMPRTMLRYSIEKLNAEEKKHYMEAKVRVIS